jgi:hypothetical protein
MDPSKLPDIRFTYPSYFPKELADHLLENIDKSGPKVEVKTEPPTTWASVELTIPGIVVVYILSTYLDPRRVSVMATPPPNHRRVCPAPASSW